MTTPLCLGTQPTSEFIGGERMMLADRWVMLAEGWVMQRGG